MKEIALDKKELIYSGRIDRRNPRKPEFIFPASSVCFRFLASKAALTIENRNVYWDNYVGAIVDGKQKKWLLNKEGQTQIALVDEKETGEHEILVFKRQDGCHEMVLCSLKLSEGSRLLSPPSVPKRKIEVYGDSVSAGEVSEAERYLGKEDPPHNGEYSNSWYSFGWMTARKLNAQIHDIAQGGIALMDKTGWFLEPNATGMESVWDKVHYVSELGKSTLWDFSQYTPDVVIVAVGQNDSHPYDYMKEDFYGEKAALWRERYRNFLDNLRKKYPQAKIICCTTLLCHDKAWDASIEQVCRQLADERISHYMFQRNGGGTPGHLRVKEAEEMANELTVYIKKIMPEEW